MYSDFNEWKPLTRSSQSCLSSDHHRLAAEGVKTRCLSDSTGTQNSDVLARRLDASLMHEMLIFLVLDWKILHGAKENIIEIHETFCLPIGEEHSGSLTASDSCCISTSYCGRSYCQGFNTGLWPIKNA